MSEPPPWQAVFGDIGPDDWPRDGLFKGLSMNQARWIACFIQHADEKRACREARITRQTVWTWKRDSEEFRGCLVAAREEMVSALFSNAMRQAERGDGNMVRWLLERLAPDQFSKRAMEQRSTGATAERFMMEGLFRDNGEPDWSEGGQPPPRRKGGADGGVDTAGQ